MTKKTNTKELIESFSIEEGLKKLTINERKFINTYMKPNRTQNERHENYKDQSEHQRGSIFTPTNWWL